MDPNAIGAALTNPFYKTVAGMIGLAGVFHTLDIAWGWVQAHKAQLAAVEKDVETIMPAAEDIAAQVGKPATPEVIADINKTLAAAKALTAAKQAAMLLFVGLLALGAGAKAEVALSDSGLFGSAPVNIGAGGQLVSTGSALAGDEVNFAWGSGTDAASFSALANLSVGGAIESQDSKQYGDLVLGLGVTLPTTHTMLTVGPAWRMFSGQRYPALVVGTSFTFGTPFWVGK
ncbi:hypothetical protein KGP36_02515 [Patescibacteria group bacterium]|nr:hypothetical protein [Patescibacteria group bacterium]